MQTQRVPQRRRFPNRPHCDFGARRPFPTLRRKCRPMRCCALRNRRSLPRWKRRGGNEGRPARDLRGDCQRDLLSNPQHDPRRGLHHPFRPDLRRNRRPGLQHSTPPNLQRDRRPGLQHVALPNLQHGLLPGPWHGIQFGFQRNERLDCYHNHRHGLRLVLRPIRHATRALRRTEGKNARSLRAQ